MSGLPDIGISNAQVGYSRLALFKTRRIAAKYTQAAPAMAALFTMRKKQVEPDNDSR